MKMKQIKEIATEKSVKAGKMGKTELIRSIQRAEGNDMEKRVKGHQKKERK
jgi:hypothetical protein